MDPIVGFFPETESGCDAISTIVCRLTKMAHSVTRSVPVTAEGLATILVRGAIRLHGVPRTIVSDGDPRFTSDIWSNLCNELNIRRCTSTAYHPRTDGHSARTNQIIEKMLRCTLLGNNCKPDAILPLLEFAYNSMQRSSTRAAPFELLYGLSPPKPLCQQLKIPTASALGILPLRAHIKLQPAKREMKKAQEFPKKQADRHRRSVEFRAGQKVWLKASNLPLNQVQGHKPLAR